MKSLYAPVTGLSGTRQHQALREANLLRESSGRIQETGGVMKIFRHTLTIVVATSATNQVGNEGMIFRFVVWHSIALAAIVGIIVMLYAYVFPGGVPHGLTFVK